LFFAEAHRLAVCIVSSFHYAHRTKRCCGRAADRQRYASFLGQGIKSITHTES
jgi:hypothetical protein